MNEIVQELVRQDESYRVEQPYGPVGKIAQEYNLDSDRLLGLLLKLDFEESHFVTCDPWKRNCGGVPRGSFVLFRIDPRSVDPEDQDFCNRLTLARVTNSAPTPVEANDQQTLFQVHKLQAQLDPLTHSDLQWGALKASIIGTFYDEKIEDEFHIGFGNDVDTFFSPFAYVAYMPTDTDLDTLINSFVQCKKPVPIGNLRYTETPSPGTAVNVPILIDPQDIVGEPTAAQRLANFGKTRFGKSNSNKIISQAIFNSGLDVAQVFFDPSGEYTYINDQDGTSLYAMHYKRSERYSLIPRALRADEQAMGLSQAIHLSINFYEFASVGHSLIVSLWDTVNPSLPGYIRPILDWSPVDRAEAPSREQDISGFNHYWRTMGMWYALLHTADYNAPYKLEAPINFPGEVKKDLVKKVKGIRTRIGKKGDTEFDPTGQPITVLRAIYRRVAELHRQHGSKWFTNSGDGSPYFNDIEWNLLRALSEDNLIAHNYIRPFNQYHSVEGISVFKEIVDHVQAGTSVFIDMAQSNEALRNNLVDRICRAIYGEQNRLFNSEEGVGKRFIMFYFEEAHRLFNKDDTNLNSVYNLLAKEGAKLNIAMVYSTQSMTTVSPDLIKNTDNFLIAHLDDDREAREVARKYAFRDIADDVQRIQSKGFVRMITRSHRFALPVQIHLFKAGAE
ncbi:MAG: hypothetical protein F4Y79_05160 [Gemmatimonadetes bacterium]|nr:hypothetical protein [Gemmatimonadota bacterium]